MTGEIGQTDVLPRACLHLDYRFIVIFVTAVKNSESAIAAAKKHRHGARALNQMTQKSRRLIPPRLNRFCQRLQTQGKFQLP